jgi:hypothetical protein
MCDGILGRDLGKNNCATEQGPWRFGKEVEEQKINCWVTPSHNTTGKSLSLPKRSELKLPVTAGSNHSEGVINRKENPGRCVFG